MDLCAVSHDELRKPICPRCASLLTFRDDLSPFEIFDLTPRFHVDQNDLESRFFNLSRQIHPDRFAAKNPKALPDATRWFAALSTAYATLKNPAERAQALFESAGYAPHAANSLPAELAEDYFAVKELVMEADDLTPLKDFQNKIELQINSCDDEIDRAFKHWDDEKSPQLLDKAASALSRRGYLLSMKNDLEKTCQKLSASI